MCVTVKITKEYIVIISYASFTITQPALCLRSKEQQGTGIHKCSFPLTKKPQSSSCLILPDRDSDDV